MMDCGPRGINVLLEPKWGISDILGRNYFHSKHGGRRNNQGRNAITTHERR